MSDDPITLASLRPLLSSLSETISGNILGTLQPQILESSAQLRQVRDELRQTNEQNVVALDTLNQRISAVQADCQSGLASLRSDVQGQMDTMRLQLSRLSAVPHSGGPSPAEAPLPDSPDFQPGAKCARTGSEPPVRRARAPRTNSAPPIRLTQAEPVREDSLHLACSRMAHPLSVQEWVALLQPLVDHAVGGALDAFTCSSGDTYGWQCRIRFKDFRHAELFRLHVQKERPAFNGGTLAAYQVRSAVQERRGWRLRMLRNWLQEHGGMADAVAVYYRDQSVYAGRWRVARLLADETWQKGPAWPAEHDFGKTLHDKPWG